jgi:hypothetical protein
MADLLKKRNDGLVTIAGGPQVDWYGEGIFDYTDAFDILSYGYSDIVKIADYIHRREGSINNVPNLIYKDNGKTKRTKRQDIDLNELVFPLYDEEVYLDVREKIMIPVVEDSRGCHYSKCYFCIHPRIGGKFVEKDMEKLVAEIEHNMKKYGFRVFRLSGPSPRAEYINRLVDSIPDGCKISAFGDSVGGYDYSRVRDNVLAIFFGLESGDKRILENLLKKTENAEEYLSRAEETINGLKKNGISTITSMIVPCADETSESMEKSMSFLHKTDPDFAPILPLTPMPDTTLTRAALAGKVDGIKVDSDYKERMIVAEVDLLQPPEMWPKLPWQIRSNGNWHEQPFDVSGQFIKKLVGKGIRKYTGGGIYPLSDEIVLMAYLYNNGLSRNQRKRRMQCLGFFLKTRKDMAKNPERIRKRVRKINENQLGGVII